MTLVANLLGIYIGGVVMLLFLSAYEGERDIEKAVNWPIILLKHYLNDK